MFEELAAGSTGAGPNGEVIATTRSLAEPLGLSKDTVARALTKLRHAGLIEVNRKARQDRTSAGASTAGRYRIVLPGSVGLLDNPPAQRIDPALVASRRPAAQQRRSVQLSLLNPAATTSLWCRVAMTGLGLRS